MVSLEMINMIYSETIKNTILIWHRPYSNYDHILRLNIFEGNTQIIKLKEEILIFTINNFDKLFISDFLFDLPFTLMQCFSTFFAMQWH